MATKTVVILGTPSRHADDDGLYGELFAKIEYSDDPKFKDSVIDLLDTISRSRFVYIDQDLEIEGDIL